jgi:hypothetical protein
LARAGKVKNVEQLLPVNGVSPAEAPSVISKDTEDKPGQQLCQIIFYHRCKQEARYLQQS